MTSGSSCCMEVGSMDGLLDGVTVGSSANNFLSSAIWVSIKRCNRLRLMFLMLLRLLPMIWPLTLRVLVAGLCGEIVGSMVGGVDGRSLERLLVTTVLSSSSSLLCVGGASSSKMVGIGLLRRVFR